MKLGALGVAVPAGAGTQTGTGRRRRSCGARAGQSARHPDVNGKKLSAQLEPRVTLLDALRDNFDLTGAKRVCDRGACGACTVLLDGKPVYACSVLGD